MLSASRRLRYGAWATSGLLALATFNACDSSANSSDNTAGQAGAAGERSNGGSAGDQAAGEQPAGAGPVSPTGGSAGAAAGGASGGLDPDAVPLRGACSGNQRVGGFVITSTPQAPQGYVGGTVKDGLDPEQITQIVASADGCQLLKRPRYTCDPGCESGSVCNSDGACQKMARTQSLGPITLRGLGVPLELKPKVPGNAYFQETPRVPSAGAPLELTTKEGYAGETALHGLGVAPLELTVGFWVLRADKPLLVRWAAPTQRIRTRVRVELSVDQHGTTPIALACDWDDDGEGSVPQDLVAQLLDAGVTGFPSGTVTRFTADSVKVPSGCMDLLVSSSESPAVQVSGYTPCTSMNQCPKDQICNTQLERCE